MNADVENVCTTDLMHFKIIIFLSMCEVISEQKFNESHERVMGAHTDG
jgi:hypothetical protein